jgi:hypothetical protein
MKVTTGRASIYRGKKGGDRVQGVLTPTSSTRFEHVRRRLAKVATREVEETSDADVIIFLTRCEQVGTRAAETEVEELVEEVEATRQKGKVA